MKVAILNVKYSPNLGDGLLAECLEGELMRHDPAIRIVPIDLAGRAGYGAHGRHRVALLRLLERLPTPLRRLAARSWLALLTVARLRPAYRSALAQCDAAVIGGGNLFADDDLNFPMKLGAGLSEATRRGLPVAVHAVGVSDNWSRAGERLFARALARARLVGAAVRDERSQAIWNRRLGGHRVAAATIARDPGLLAARCYGLTGTNTGRVAALCITDPLAIRYHSGAVGHDVALDDWYTAAITALAESGWEVALFTNGSPEDRAYLDRQARRWAGPRVQALPPFEQPRDLVATVAVAGVVIAHRMHACIAAYSCGVPPIGLRWDPKLDSFFTLSDREAFLLDTDRRSAHALPDIAERALAAGIDRQRHAELSDAAEDSIARLAAALRAAVTA